MDIFSPIVAKAAAYLSGAAFTGVGLHFLLKVANKMDWEPFFVILENAGKVISKAGNLKFTASTYEPIEAFLQSKVDVGWARFKKGLDLDDSTGNSGATPQTPEIPANQEASK